MEAVSNFIGISFLSKPHGSPVFCQTCEPHIVGTEGGTSLHRQQITDRDFLKCGIVRHRKLVPQIVQHVVIQKKFSLGHSHADAKRRSCFREGMHHLRYFEGIWRPCSLKNSFSFFQHADAVQLCLLFQFFDHLEKNAGIQHFLSCFFSFHYFSSSVFGGHTDVSTWIPPRFDR